MSFRAFRKGFKGVEIPIVFSDRTHGLSKMNKGIMAEAIRIPWLLRWWTMVGRL
jgi:dolichol-phosphate mannosyltransferase